MNELLVFLLLLVAVASGWLFGRRTAQQGEQELNNGPASLPYYRGMNYLVSDQSDAGIESFLQSIDVNHDTIELHISLGNLLRRKGEVDRSIKIHQNLLGRPNLPLQFIHSAHLELARDYIAAGLLDRAERLLQDLAETSRDFRSDALKLLMEIYQLEKDWAKAVTTAQVLRSKSRLKRDSAALASLNLAIAHFHCELAAQDLKKGDIRAARIKLNHAYAIDRQCVRAALLLAELEYQAGHPRKAIKAARRISQYAADFLPESLPTLKACYLQLDDAQAYRQFLSECLEYSRSPVLVLALCREIEAAEGKDAAEAYLSGWLTKHSSLKVLAQLNSYYLQDYAADSKAGEVLYLLQEQLQQLVADMPAWQCGHCGFRGNLLHWLCPGCRQWNTLRPVWDVAARRQLTAQAEMIQAEQTVP